VMMDERSECKPDRAQPSRNERSECKPDAKRKRDSAQPQAMAQPSTDDVLRRGFAAAHQRLGLIFFDILWKAIWLIATVAALFLMGAWLASDLRAAAWGDTGIPALNAWI